mgnify:CR=1 FL=1
MKKKLITLLLVASTQFSYANDYITTGEGKLYMLETLAKLEGSGVTKSLTNDSTYTIGNVITIAKGDSLSLNGEEAVSLLFADGAGIVVEGVYTSASQNKVWCGKENEAATPLGIVIEEQEEQAEVGMLELQGVRLTNHSSQGLRFHQVHFEGFGEDASGAFVLQPSGAPFLFQGCSFKDNRRAAIGGAANYYCPLQLKQCHFMNNSLANSNIPQLNLTVADSIVIDECTVQGNPELYMVGGIGVSNFMAVDQTKVVIRNSSITGNRYGIGTVGPMNIRIEGNVLTDNCHELNPMNGGSGISLYDPYMQTNAYIQGNRIEGSLWGVTVIGCQHVNMGRVDVAADDADYNPGQNRFKDNGNNGVLYDLYNNSGNTVYAQGNFWNVDEQTEELIETVVFHQKDDASLGEVIFMPAGGTATGIAATGTPASPAAATLYNLHGQHLKSTPRHGLYIKGGKLLLRR